MSPDASQSPTALSIWLGRIVLAVWIPGLLVALAALMVGHWVPLPTPDVGDRAVAAAFGSPHAERDGRWTLHHVLYVDCPCSRRILDYLAESERPAEAREVVLLVGRDAELERGCEASGIEVVHVTANELERDYGVVSAPLFLVGDPSGQPVLAGGYTGRKQGLDYADVSTLRSLIAGGRPEPLPVYGCGVAASLQDALDPLGIKY